MCPGLAQNDAGDEVARNDEEDVDAGKPARQHRGIRVKHDHRQDRQRAEAVDIRSVLVSRRVHQCMPEPPASCLTSSPMTFFASPNSIHVRSAKYSSLSMPANPGFLLRLIAKTLRALSASMIGIP